MKNEFYLNFKSNWIIPFLCFFFLAATSFAQNNVREISGVVVDENSEPLAGATVRVKNDKGGVIVDVDGKFTLKAKTGDIIEVTFLGMKAQEMKVDSRNFYAFNMQPESNEFDEVTVVAFAKQKKESVISSISTVNPQDLRVPSSNLTTALGGRIAGLIAFQKSGEPGKDNAEFFVRGATTFGYKKDPLILIDNIELTTSDLARLNVDDIAQFSIMKDATATALYGARGANGVIFVTTKEGTRGKPKVNVRVEESVSMPRQKVKLTDPITYMRLNNEAVNTRLDVNNPAASANLMTFSQDKIEKTMAGVNPYYYPAVDWYKELFNDAAFSTRANVSLSGGGSAVRYYVAASYTKDGGVIKNDKLNNYNNNIDYKRYSVRSNINIDLTKTTEFNIRVNGNFDDYTGPMDSGNDLYKKVMMTSPVLYPKAYPAAGQYANSTHILFGNTEGNYINPYADMVRGYKDYNNLLVVAQAELKQKLDFILPGLDARVMVNTTRSAYNEVHRYTTPYYYQASGIDKETGELMLIPLNENSGKEYLEYNEANKTIETTNYLEAALNYNHTFGAHGVSGMLVFMRSNKTAANPGSLQQSLPRRNQGLSGRFTYAYDSRYFAEFNFGYNGSERFAKNERYGFFPSFGVGYLISNEKFWEPWKKVVDKLKFKLTYGLVGNDAIGDSKDRFYYLSEVNMDDNGRGQYFGTDYGHHLNGISVRRYPNEYITWEKSKKTNFGIELGMFNSALDIQADFFYEYRTQIYQGRSYVPSTMGLSAGVSANIGEASSRGVDISANYSFINNKDFWLKGMGNFTFARGKYEKYEELNYDSFGEGYRSRIGQPINYNYGFIAERLFVDENDIANSPSQSDLGSEVMAGDIKYKDLNGDGKITGDDQTFLGYPNQPEITDHLQKRVD